MLGFFYSRRTSQYQVTNHRFATSNNGFVSSLLGPNYFKDVLVSSFFLSSMLQP